MRFTQLALLSLAVAVSHAATAAKIEGTVLSNSGIPLQGVRVCLRRSVDTTLPCAKTKITNKGGGYSFKGLSSGESYSVSVFTDSSLKSRRAQKYKSYVWNPLYHEAVLKSKNDIASDADFVGSFNFSNFQPEVKLTSVDFPSLATYDFASDTVFLKVYTEDSGDDSEDLIFIGEVQHPSTLSLVASVPLSDAILYYQTYSLSAPNVVGGEIVLSESAP